jgi:hypothetical protein
MNRYFFNLSKALLLAALVLPMWAAPLGRRTFVGEITDGICGMNGSHAQMMKSMANMGTDRETCTKQCIRLGVAFMLYDPTTQTAYHLDEPAKAEAFAGKNVRIAGTLEGNTIKIGTIEAAN